MQNFIFLHKTERIVVLAYALVQGRIRKHFFHLTGFLLIILQQLSLFYWNSECFEVISQQ